MFLIGGPPYSGTTLLTETETDVDGSFALSLPGVIRGTLGIDARGYEIVQRGWSPHRSSVNPFILLETGVEIGGWVTTPSGPATAGHVVILYRYQFTRGILDQRYQRQILLAEDGAFRTRLPSRSG